MNITKENNELVLCIPLTQKGSYTYGEGEYEVDNLVGIDNGEYDYTISYLNYLDYKDDFQEGMPIINITEKEEFESACKILGLQIWKHNKCNKCKKTIYGSFTIDEDGKDICLGCN